MTDPKWESIGIWDTWLNDGSGEAVFGATGGDVTLTQNISANKLTFEVDGYRILGTNGTSGPFIISLDAGGITADGNADILSGLSLISSQTWSVLEAKTLTVSGPIAGTGGVNKAGTGSLTLSGANTFSGTTTLGAGTLTLGNVAALAGSTLDLALGGSGTLSFASEGTYQLGGLAGTRNLALGTSSIAVGGNNASTAYSGILSGTGGLTKAGTGTLTLSGVNTFSGKVAVTGGILSIGLESALGATPASFTADALTLAGGTLAVTTGNQTFSANRGITLGAGGGTIDTSSIADTTGLGVTFAGAISGSGNLTLKTHGDLSAGGGGSNTLVSLTGANTFTGTVTISDGLVNAASGFGDAANTLRFANGGGLILVAGTNTFTRAIEVLSTGGIIRQFGSTTLNLASTLTGSGTLSRTDSGTLNLTGDITGFTGTFANLAGTTVIDTQGASAFSAINLAGGGLYVRHNPLALGSATITVNGSATLGSNGSAAVDLANAISITGSNILTLAGSNAAPYVHTGAITGASSTLVLGSGVTLAGTGSSGSILTFGEGSGAIIAHGFAGTYGTVRLTPINIGGQGVGMMIGGSLTATSQAQDNRDAQFAFLQTGGSATFGRLATGQTESGQNEGGEGGFSFYGLQGGTLSLGSILAGGGGGWADRGLYLYATGGTLRATATGNWTPFFQVVAAGDGVVALNSNGFNVTFTRNIAGTGVLNLTGATGSVILSNLTAVTNSFAGSGALNKSNASTTVFSGDFANYTGALTLSGGTAQFNSATDTAFAGAISGSGVFSKAGSGTLRLTGTNTWSSNATITAGALSLASTSALPGWSTASRWSVSAGATLAVGNAITDAQFETIRALSGNFAAGAYSGFDTQLGDRTYAGTLAGSVGISKVGANTLTLTGASAFTGPIGVFGGTLDLSGSSLANAGAVTLAGGSLVDGRISSSTALSGQSGNLGASLLGTGGIAKTTSGVLALSGVNSYTGATTISAGTLVIDSIDALPRWNQAGGFSVASGAGLAVGNVVTDGQVSTLLGTGNFAAGSRIGFDTSAGDRTYGATLANTAAGALGLVKTGPGTLYVVGANTFTGPVHVAGGTLAFSSLADSGSSNLGIGTALSLDNGTLRFTGTTATTLTRTLALTGSGNVIQVDAGGVLTLGPNTSNAHAGWSGSGGVTKTGAGTLTVGNNHATSTNRFNVGSDTGGNFTMAEGVLNISPNAFLTFGENSQDSTFLQTGGVVNFTAGSGSYLGNGSGGPYSASLIITGGTFNQSAEWMRVGQNGYSRGFLTIGGGAGPAVANVNQVQLGSAGRYASGTLTLLSGGTLVANTVNRGNGAAVAIFDGGTLRANSNTANLLSGVATVIRSGGAILDDAGFTVSIAQGLNADGVGSGGVTKLGSGTLRLLGVNTYAGNTLLTAGTLTAFSADSLPGWNVAGRWTAASGTTLAVGNGFAGSQLAALVATGNLAAGATLGFDTAEGNRAFSGTLADGPNGPLAVTKLGANTLTLSGSSTYTGLTTVLNGTLELASRTALADATNLQVRSGATLMFEVSGAADFTNADLATLLPSLYDASGVTGLRSGSLLGFDTEPGSFTLDTALTNSTGANGGAVGLTKIGANTLTLAGTNTYTGATTLSGGTLALGSGASITGGGSLTISGGAFLDLGGGTSTFGAVTVSALPASGSAIRNGTLVAGSVTYNHTSGTELVGATFSLSGRVGMNAAGSLEFGSGSHNLAYFDIYNGGRIILSGGTTTASGRSFIGTGTLAISGGVHSMQGIRGSEGSGTTTVINQTGGTLTITGTTVQVGTDNSFLLNHWGASSAGGTYNLSAGTLNVLSTNVLLHWDGTGTFNQSGGTANLLGLDFNTSRGAAAAYNLSGGRLNIGVNGIVANNSAETFSAGAGTLGALADWSTSKTISLTDATTGFTVDTTDAFAGVARTLTLSGILSGAGRLNVTGSGTVVLNAANTNTGLVTVSGGALRLSNATSLAGGIGATGGTAALSLNGGVVDLAAGDFTRALGTGAGQVAFAGSGGFAATGAARTVNLGGAAAQVTWGSGSFVPEGNELRLGHANANNTLTFANPIALGAADRTVRVARGTGTMDGVLSGALTGDGGLVKAGEGLLSLTGTNTYSGNTTVSAGVLAVGGTSSLSGWDTSGRWSVASGAALAVGNSVTDANVATLLVTGNLASGAAIGFDTSAGDRSWSSALADTAAGALGLAKVGANTLTLAAANTHTGVTTLHAGSTLLTHADALATSTVRLSGGSLAFGSAVAGNAFALGGLTGTSNLALQNNAATPAAVTLTVGANNASTTYSGTLSGAGSLTKAGSGTLTLQGVQTHTGATTASAGTLVLQSNLAGALVAEAGTTITVQHATGLAGLYSANGGGAGTADLDTRAALDVKMGSTAVTVAASSAVRGANFDFATNGSGFPAPYNAGASSFVARWTGQFYAETAGTYTFFTASDDGSKIWVNGQQVVSNNFAQGVTERSGAITLAAGWHDIGIGFMNISGGYGLYANLTTPGGVKAALPNALLRSAPIVGSLTTAAGSTLDLGSVGLVVNQTATTTAAGALIGSGSLTKVGNGTLTLADVAGHTGGYSSLAGKLIVTGDLDLGTRLLEVGPAVDLNLGPGLTLSGAVSGTSGLTKTGNGILALTNAANTFSGNLQVNRGTLAASSDGALGDAANHIVLANGTIFRAIGTFASARSLDLAPGPSTTTIQVAAGNTLTFTGTLLDASATTQIIKADNGTLALGSITAPNWSGSLNQLNDPTVLTGGIRVDAGVLRIDSSSALSASNVVVVNNYQGAAVEIADGVNLAATFVGNINTSNSAQGLYHGFGLGNLFVSSGTGTLSGELNLRQDAGIGAAAGATLNVAGNIRLTGHILTVLGAGTTNLSGAFVNAPTGFYKLGSGNLNITTAVPVLTGTGMYLLGGGGTTTFSGAGSIAAGWTAGGLNIRGGDTLVLDNSGTNLANRLGGAVGFTGRDGTLRLVNSASSAVTETLGALTASHGYTRLVVDTTAQASLLSLSSITVNGGGTLVFESAGTGANFGTASNTVRARDALPGVLGAAPGQAFLARAFVVDGLGTNFAQYSNGSIRGFQAYDTSDLNALSAAGVSPTAVWTPTLQLSASATLGAHRTVNALKLTGGGLVLGGSGAALTLASGGLLATGGTSTLAAGSFIQGGANEIWIGVADGSTLNLEGAVNTSGIITKALGGTLNIAAPIYSTASWYILNGGTTNLLADNVLYPGQGITSGTQNLSISYGATLDLKGTSQMVGLHHSPSNNQFSGVAGLLTNSSENKALFVTNSSAGSGDLFPGVRITGNLSVVQAGNRTRYLYNDNTYTGRTAILNNLFVLSDEGRLSATSGVDVNYGARLYIRNTGSRDLADRLNDSAALTLRGGGVEFNGRAQTNSAETFGDVTLAQGWNTFLVNSGGIGVYSADLVIGTFSATGGVMTIDGINSQPGSASRLRVQDNAVGAVNGIVPYAVYARDLVGYVADQGFSYLGAAGFPTYGATSLSSGLNPTLNVKTTATTGVTLSSNTSVNSLLWNYGNSSPTVTLGTNTLTLTAGVLALATGNENTNFTVTGGFLQSGTSDLYIHKLNYGGTGRRATISSVIQDGTAGATRLIVSSGDGVGSGNYVTLTAANTYTGGTVINGGQVQLGAVAGTVVLPAGGVTLNGGTLTVVTNGGQIAAANTVTLNGPATLVLASTNTLQQLVFNNTGGTSNPGVSGGTLTLSSETAIVANGYNPSTISTVSSTLDFANTAKTITVNPLTYDGKAFAPYLPNLNLSGIVQNAGLITVNGGGVLQVSGASTFSGGYSIAAGTALAIGASSTGAVTSGPLGTGTLTLASGARLQSTGGHTVSNAVSVNGEVEFEGVTSLTLSGGVTLAADGTFDIQAPQPTLTLSGVVAGAGRTLTKTGYGTLSLTGANTFDGGATVSRGTLSLGNAAALGTGTLTLSGGALDSSVANLTLSTNNAQAWNGGFNFTGTQSLNLGTGAVTLGADVTVGVSANTLTVGGAIGDSGANRGLTKVGNGILRLSGANNYGGTTNINAGVLVVNATTALPGWDTAGRVAVRNGAALAVGAGVTDANVATMLATGNFASGGAIGFDVATADRTWSSALTGTMGLAVLDTDTAAVNTLTVSGDNNFSGGTTVYSGGLIVGHQNALRGSVVTLRGGSVAFASTAGSAFTFGGLSGTANLALQNNAGTPAAIALTVGSAGTDTVYNGVLSGAGSLTKVGAGTLTLTGSNSFSGGLNVNGGTVLLAAASQSWNTSIFGSLATVNNGGRLQVGTGNNTGSAATITVNGGGVLEYLMPYSTGGAGTTYIGTVNLAGSAGLAAEVSGVGASRFGYNVNGLINSTGAVTNTWSAAVQLLNNNKTMTITTGADNTLVISGVIHEHAGYEGIPLTKNGAGTLVLSGANTYTGTTTLSAGILRLANSLALQSTSLTVSSTLQFDAAVVSRAFTVGGLAGAGNVTLQNSAATPEAVALTIGRNNASTAYSGVLSGAGSLIKVGTGTLTLSGNNSFAGGLSVNAGALVLSGANTFSGGLAVNAGTVTVSAGSSLPGLSTPGRNTVASGATLAGANGLNDADLALLAANTTWSAGSLLGLDTSAGNRALAGGLSGAFGLSKLGANTLALSGANTFTGGLSVNAGTAVVNDLTSLPGNTTAGLNRVASGAILAFGNAITEADYAATVAAATVTSGGFVGFDTTAGDRTLAAAITGANGFAKTGNGTLALGAGGTFTGALNITGGTLALGGSNTLGGGTYAGAITLATGTTLSIGTSANQTLSGGFSGAGTLAKSGTGTLTLSHASNSPAAINLTEGTLALASVNAAQWALVDVGSAGAQRLAFTVAGTNTYTVGGLQGADAVELGANSLTIGGNNITSVYNGSFTGTGSWSKIGSGTFTLNGASFLTGNVTANTGTVWLGGGGPTVLGNLVVNGGNGAVAVYTSRANQFLATSELQGTSASGFWNRFELYGNNQTVAGISTGNSTTVGGFVVQNSEANGAAGAPATLTLAGSGTYVFNGHLRDKNDTAAGANPLFINKTGSGTQSFYGAVISYSGMTTVTGGTLLLSLAAANTTFVSPINNQATVTLDNTNAWKTVSALGGSGTYNKTGSGVLTVNGSQLISATGQINLQAGTLQNDNNNVNWAANRADIAVSSGAILELYADAVFLDVLSGAGTVQNNFGNAAGSASTGVAGFERLVLGTNSGTGSFAGLIRDNPGGTVPGGSTSTRGIRLEKLGTGTQTFTTAHTYTGGTWVGGGTLDLDFTGLATPTNLLSASGGLLLNGGTLSIKGKAATATAQTFAGLTLAAGGGQLLVNPNGATSATVTLGALTATAAGGSALVGLAPAAGAGTLAINTTSAVTDGIFSGRLVYTDGTNYDFAGTASGASPFTLGALGTYAELTGAAATTNARITASASVAANQTVKTLKVQAPAAAQSLAIGSGITLNVAAGLLFTGTEAFSVTGGTLAGGTGSGGVQDLVIHQYNSGGVTIGSTVANNGANITALTKAGTGALTLSANATYTGTTFLNAGSLTFGGTSASTTLQVAGGTLVLNGVAAATTYNLNGGSVRVGAAGVVAAGATLNVNSGTFDLNGQNVTVANLGAGGVLGTVTDNAAGTGTSTLAVTGYTNSTYTLFADGATRKLALSLTNENSAPFLLNPSNTFSGGFLIRNSTAGTRLNVSTPTFNTGVAGAIVSSPFGRGTITIGEAATDKAQIFVSNSSVAILNDIVFNTAVGTDRPGAIRNDTHGLTLAGTLTAGLAPVNLTGNSSGTTLITGRITGNEGLWVRQTTQSPSAVQTVVLGNLTGQANDYLGNTTIDTNQVIRLAANEQLPDGGGFGNVAVAGTLNLYGNTETLNGLSGAGVVEGGAAIPLLRVGAGDAAGSFSGVIRNSAGTLSLEKIGSGVQFLSGANTYGGTTTVSGGVLAVASASSLPGWSTNGRVSVASGGALALGNAFTDADVATFLGTTALAAGSSLGFDTSTGNRTYAVSIANTSRGALGLVKVGANVLTLTGTNTYSGLTAVRGGVLSAASATAIPSLSAGAFRVDSGAALALGNSFSDAAVADALATDNFRAGSAIGFDTTDGDRTYSVAIADLAAGSLGLAKVGTNTLLASGNSTFTGATQVLGGTLRLGNAAALGTVAGGATVASGATLDLNGQAIGAEAVTLSGSLVNDGASSASLLGTVNLAAASTLGGSGDLTLAGIVSGSGVLTKSGAGRVSLTAVNTATGNLAITAGTLEVGGSGQLGSGTFAGTIANAGILAITSTANQTLSGVISGAGSLTKSGNGLLTLSGANTFAGGLTLAAGTVRLNANAAAGTGTITLGDASTGSSNVALLINNNSDPNNAIVVSALGSGAVTIGSDGGGAGNNPTLFGGNLTLNRATTLTAGSTDRTTYSGIISGNVGTLTIAGGARTTFGNGGNDYVGDTLVSAGSILQIDVAGGVLPDATNLTVNGNLYFNALAQETVASLAGSGNIQVHPSVGGAHTLLISGSANTTYSGTVQNGGGTLALTKSGSGTQVMAGNISTSGAITVSGGLLDLTAANTLSGNITIGNGTLRVAGSARIYSGTHRTSVVTINSGGVLELENWGYNLTSQSLGGLQAQAASIVSNGGTIRIVGTTATSYTRGVTINAGGLTLEAAAGANWTLGADTAFALSGNPSITLGGAGTGTMAKAFSGTGGITKTGSGTWTLSGVNTHSGATTVNAGTLAFGVTNAIGASSALTLGSAGSRATLDLVSHAATTSSLTFAGLGGDVNGSGTLTLGASAAIAVFGATQNAIYTDLAFANAASFAVASGGALTLHGDLTGAGGLTKTGAGTLQFFGNNDFYSGAIAVNGGTLRLLGGMSALGTGTVTLSGGAILDLNSIAVTNTINVVSGSIINALSASSVINLAGTVSVGDGGAVLGTYNLASGANATFTGEFQGVADLASGATATFSAGLSSTSTLNVLAGATASLAGDIDGLVDVHGAATVTGNLLHRLDVDGTLALSGATADGSVINVMNGGVATLSGALAGEISVKSGGAATLSGSAASTATLGILSGGTATLTGSFAGHDILNGGALVLDRSSDLTLAADISGAGTLEKRGSAKVTLTGANAFAGDITVTAGTLELGSSGTLGASASHAGAIALAGNLAVATSANQTLGGAITGAGALLKSGSGTLTLAGANTFSGGITVTGGTLAVSADAALGSTATHLTLNGGTLGLTLGNQSLAANRGISLGASGGAIQTLSTPETLANTVTVAGAITGQGSLSKQGLGTLVLTGTNTFAGGLTVAAGRLDVTSLGALGSGQISVGPSGELRFSLALTEALNLSTAFAGGLGGTGLLDLNLSGESALSLGSYANFGGSVRLTSGVFDNTGFSGNIIFSGGRLLNPASFAGTTTISGAITDISLIPTSGTIVLDAGGSIDFGSTVFTGAITYRGGSVSGSGFQGTLNVEGQNVAISGSFGNGKLSVGAGNSITLSGPTAGTVVFAGGAIAGGANLTGTLEVGNGRALVIGQGLDVFGNGATLAIGGGSLDLAGSSSSGTIAFSGGSLAGAANFAGTLAVSGGATLSTDGTVGGTVNLASGTTLAGNGTFTGTVTAGAGSVLAPGSSPGLTTYGTLNLTGGSTLQLEFFSNLENIEGVGRGYDSITAGTLNFGTAGNVGGGKITLQLATLTAWSDDVADWNGTNGLTPAEGSTLIHSPGEEKFYTIARFNASDRLGALSDGLNVTSWFAFDTDLFEGTGATGFAVFVNTGDTSTWELNLRAIPEPSTYGLILGGLALAGAAIRRRKRNG